MEGCIVQCDYVSSHVEHLNKHLKFGEKPNTCKKYDYTSSRVDSLREYLKTHTEKEQTSAASVILHPLRQATWEDIWKHTLEKVI